MFKKFLFIVFTLFYISPIAQNLIEDGSFEDNKAGMHCEWGLHELSNTWKGYGTCELMKTGQCAASYFPRYFDSCGKDTVWSIDYWGYQLPQHLNYQAAIRLFHEEVTEWHEFVYTPLLQPLDSNKTYVVSLYVSPSEGEDYLSKDIGVGFSKIDIPQDMTLINYPYGSNIAKPYFFYNLPHVMYIGDDSLYNYNEWIKISMNFQASGGERFLAIGNFKPDSQTKKVRTRLDCCACSPSARFFIDNVTVEECQLDYFSFPYDSILICKNGVFEVDLSSFKDSIIWMDGRTEKIREISETGVYTVTYTNGICSYSDSFYLYELDTITNLEDVIVCSKSELPIVLSPQVNYHSDNKFFLNGQSISSTFSIYESGSYEFKVYNDDCYIKKEFKVVNLEELSAFYPNPSNGKFQIDNPLKYPIKAKVYDLFGREVSEIELLNEIDLSNLSDGVYLIVFDKECLETRKIVIKK
jgi:hypothetical protein